MSFCLGIVGAGGIARAHLSAVESSAGQLSIAAVVDPVDAARTSLADAAKAPGFASLDALYAAKVKVDAIVICTPPSARIDLFKLAAAHKTPVLLEKPLAHTLADARQLQTLAAQSGSKAFVGYCHRFTPAVIEIKRRIAAGELGQITRFENTFACDLPHLKDKWMSDPKLSGGGALMDMGCHSLDLMRFIVGDAKVVAASLSHRFPGRAETGATVLLSLSSHNHAPAIINAGWAEASNFTFSVVGSNGTLAYDYEKPTDLLHIDLVGKRTVLPIESHDVRFQRQLLALAGAVQGKAATLPATFADGVATAELIDAAYTR